jgi:hypothetical protein
MLFSNNYVYPVFRHKKGLSENFPDSPLIQLLINDYFIISFFVITELPFLRFT